MKLWNRMYRGIAPIVAAGVLLQAGGCTFDLNTVAAGLINSIATNFLASLIFGVFNLATI